MHSVPMSLQRRTLWLITFSIAMGYLEAAVVVYLRYLYYPSGFEFPLVVMSAEAGVVEILREAATVIMLLAIGILTGYNARQRLAYFLISFAVWDLFYYVFLKLTLDWPASFFTWDILFLIPAPWVGPVLSPIIVCALMLALAFTILKNERRQVMYSLNWQEWALILTGSLVVVIAWMRDYITYSGRVSDSPDRAMTVLASYVPSHFSWPLFMGGVLLIALGNLSLYRRSR